MKRTWMLWSLLEGVTRASSNAMQKLIGVSSIAFSGTILATTVVGVVQVIGAFIILKARGLRFLAPLPQIFGACGFGLLAFVMTVLGFYVFLLGGDIGIKAFLVTLSIIPGALIDRMFFGKKISAQEGLGILVAIFGGYVILGSPSLSGLAEMPAWVWLSLAIGMMAAINQGISKKIKKIDPFVKNFWGGLTTLILGVVGLAFVPLPEIIFAGWKIWVGGLITGLIVIGLWSFNILSYRFGANIALKKVIAQGTNLSLSVFFGIIFFGEDWTPEKGFGILLFVLAFWLMDKK